MDTVELVGGGLAEWPSGAGPRGETIAPAAYVDVSTAEHLLDLPHRFHAAGDAWKCAGVFEPEPLALTVHVTEPVAASFRIPLDAAKHAALIGAVLRDSGIYICVTTPRHGINARLARDQSFWIDVDQSFAQTWRSRQA